MSEISKKEYYNERGDFQSITPEIRPLKCSACGASIPLQDTENQKCFNCGTMIALPGNFFKLRESKREFDRSVRNSEKLYRRIAKGPGWFLSTWTAVANGIAGVLGVLGLVLSFVTGLAGLVMIAMVYIIARLLAPVLKVDYVDTIGGGTLYVLVCAGLCILVLLPMVLSNYFDDLVNIKKILQASLSIHFASHGKGVGDCRSCGSVLEINQDTICVRCPYCGTDNLTALPEATLRKVNEFARWHFRTAEEAVALEEKYKRESRSNLYLWIFISLGLCALAWGAGAIFTWSDLENTPTVSWGQLEKQPKEMVFAKPEFEKETFPSLPIGKPITVSRLGEYYWVSLRYGELLTITTSEPDAFLSNYMRNATDTEGSRLYQSLEWSPNNGVYETSFRAPYTGKFCWLPLLTASAAGKREIHLRIIITDRESN